MLCPYEQRMKQDKLVKRLILTLCLILLVGVPVTNAQEPVAPPVSPELLDYLDDLEATVVDIRQLDTLTPVIRLFPSRQEAIDFIFALYEEEFTDDIVAESTYFYRAFGFVGDAFDLKTTILELQADQVAGFYYPETQEMNTILFTGGELGTTLPPLEQFIYSHEFTHALQDQHFGLANYITAIEEPDQALAALALVEGDATLVAQEYMTILIAEQPLAALQLLGFSLLGGADLPEGIPPVLENELLMPYLEGMNFVTAVRNAGGWQAVNNAYTNLPQSTEQILHPQKYLDGEAPQDVAVQAFDHVLGSGWMLVHERVLGEFYLGQHLATQLSQRAADRAAAGWGGDRYRLYYNDAADEFAWLLRIAWDSAEEMTEFSTAYADFAAAYIGSETAVDGCWTNAETEVTLCLTELAGDTYIVFAPEAALAQEIMASQG